MTAPNRTQTLVFQPFDGKTNATSFFDAVRERGFTGISYPATAVDGTLPVTESANVTDAIIETNKKHYANLYVEMARSLTNRALITKRTIDIAEPKSGFNLLEALRT